MSYRLVPIENLSTNRANDRHGELENETAAIAWLFSNMSTQMRGLAKDIVNTGGIYEPPLVCPEGDRFTVYDGNRRITCLKLLSSPGRAPSIELKNFFADLRAQWEGSFPVQTMCRVESDRDKIDEILYRRHTGSQGGVGQSNWDDRMKSTFVNRTGKGGKLNIADEIESRLKLVGLMPSRGRIPRSNLNRLLSAEAFRHRVGITIAKGRFEFTRKEDAVLKALARIADDLARRRKTLDDVWDVDRKLEYLDELEAEGILPTAADALQLPKREKPKPAKPDPEPELFPDPKPIAVKASRLQKRLTLIPHHDYGVAWAGRLQRHKDIWNELQYKLRLEEHPNAIAVLCRVLLELSVDNYIKQAKLAAVFENDPLAKKLVASAENLHTQGKINKRYLEVVRKARAMDAIISVDTLNKYVHSPNLAPASDHLMALWDTFADLVVHCLNK